MKTTERSVGEADRLLAKAIRARRKTVGLTQEQLAKACGVSFQQMQKYENGSNRVSFSRLVQIARALSTTVAELTTVLEDGDPALAPPQATISDYELYRTLPGAHRLLRLYGRLTPTGRAMLLDFLKSAAAEAPARRHPREGRLRTQA